MGGQASVITEEQKLEAFLAPIRAANLKSPDAKEKRRMAAAIQFDLDRRPLNERETRKKTFKELGYVYD